MMTFGEAIRETGATAMPGTDLVLAMLPNNGRIVHYVAANLAEQPIDATTNVYLASGTFATGTITPAGGRSQENLRAVMWLPFDADLTDYSGMDADYLHGLLQADIDRWIEAQRKDLVTTFAHVGLRIHRLDYTGYGLCAYLYLEPVEQADLQLIRDAHKAFIKAVNDHAGYRLLDPQASDSGTRITRLPGSHNIKNADMPRKVTTLHHDRDQFVTLDQLRFALKRAQEPPKRVALPDSTDLPSTTADELVAALQPHWTLGHKHAMALAFAGMCAKAGVPESQTLVMIERLSAEDTKPWDRHRCVRDTYARLGSGLDTRGFWSLRDMLPETVIAYVAERLDRIKGATAPAFGRQVVGTVQEAKKGPVSDLTIQPIPSVCFQGWVGEYVSMMLPLSEAPESFHLASGLALMGATAGRRVSARYVSKPVYGNLYMMLVGIAGESRKDTAIEFAINLPHYTTGRNWHEPPYKIATDIGSGEGLIKVLSDQPNTWLYITEYQRLSRQAKRQSTGTIFPMLTSAWNSPPALQNLTKGAPVTAKLPYLSTIAAVQPGILAEEMTQEDMESGYASRWLYIPGEGRDPIPYPPNIDEHQAYALYGELLQIMKVYDREERGVVLQLTEQAKAQWIGWYHADRRRAVANDDEASVRSRLGVHIQKLALLYAAGSGASAIDIEHLEPATEFVEWTWRHTRQLMQTWGVPVFSKIETRIVHVLTERGPMKRRQLQGLCRGRKYGAREFAQVLDAMIKNGTVETDPEGNLRHAGD